PTTILVGAPATLLRRLCSLGSSVRRICSLGSSDSILDANQGHRISSIPSIFVSPPIFLSPFISSNQTPIRARGKWAVAPRLSLPRKPQPDPLPIQPANTISTLAVSASLRLLRLLPKRSRKDEKPDPEEVQDAVPVAIESGRTESKLKSPDRKKESEKKSSEDHAEDVPRSDPAVLPRSRSNFQVHGPLLLEIKNLFLRVTKSVRSKQLSVFLDKGEIILYRVHK
ncbi:hypothetical protein LINGRAHAP2_LOCUS11245, partial [Linum grandiflorum]